MRERSQSPIYRQCGEKMRDYLGVDVPDDTRYGRGKTADEILIEATGRTIDPAAYLDHLQSRFH